jgi:hypothetical protein
MVGLLREQMNEVHRKMGDTAVRPQRYEGAFNRVSNALDIRNLTASWGSYKQYLRTEVLDAMGWCADTLPAEEELIEPEDLDTFRSEIHDFAERISVSDLPDNVKSFAFQQVSIMEQALRDYPVVGAQAFQHGSANSFVNVLENRDTFLEHQDEEEMQQLRGLWQRLQELAQKAGPWIAIGQAAAKVIELTSGN